jgi:hypothetical protein
MYTCRPHVNFAKEKHVVLRSFQHFYYLIAFQDIKTTGVKSSIQWAVNNLTHNKLRLILNLLVLCSAVQSLPLQSLAVQQTGTPLVNGINISPRQVSSW